MRRWLCDIGRTGSRATLPAWLALSVLCPLVMGAHATSYTFTTIDVPFSGASETTCTGLNTRESLVGLYLDAHGRDQGFAKRGPKFILVPLLTPRMMNNAGHFTGWYHDGALFGFLFTGVDFRPLMAPYGNLTEAADTLVCIVEANGSPPASASQAITLPTRGRSPREIQNAISIGMTAVRGAREGLAHTKIPLT